MARASRQTTQAATQASASSAGATTNNDSPPATDTGAAPGAQWTRDAMSAWLVQARGLFDMAQTLQQAHVRALQDVAGDFETAIDALEEAEDLATLSAVPGRLLQAQWQHALNNGWEAMQRLMEIESAWLQEAQAHNAQRVAALAAGVPNWPGASAMSAVPWWGNGQGNNAASMPEQWQEWFERWQQGVEQMSRQWSEAVKSAQRS